MPILRGMTVAGSSDVPLGGRPDHFRQHGLRWTPQRRLVLEVLEATDGHVTGGDLVERCRALDPSDSLDRLSDARVLEELGIVRTRTAPTVARSFMSGRPAARAPALLRVWLELGDRTR